MSNKNASKRAGGRSNSWYDEQLRQAKRARQRATNPTESDTADVVAVVAEQAGGGVET